jgi:hypothetical protein
MRIRTIDDSFYLMHEGFERASGMHPHAAHQTYYTFAGQTVKIRIVGTNLARRIHQAFAHLMTDSTGITAPHLTIDIWDEKETGVFRPMSPAKYNPGVHKIYSTSSGTELFLYWFQHTLVYYDPENSQMVSCVSGAEELSLYEQGRPFHPPLTLWHNDQDVPVIHAGLVSLNGKGLLLAGMGGAGKSTAALTCLAAGFSYLSDDLIGLRGLSDNSFWGHSLYNSTYIEPHHLTNFPHLKPFAIKGTLPGEDKVLILLSQVWPARLVHTVGIRAILLPRIGNGHDSRIWAAPKAKALFALVPSSRQINKRLGASGFDKLAKLVDQIPCYWLELGRDLNQIPHCIQQSLPVL